MLRQIYARMRDILTDSRYSYSGGAEFWKRLILWWSGSVSSEEELVIISKAPRNIRKFIQRSIKKNEAEYE